ncbi:hypothetical protein K8I28_15175 [bacterium]|nr:hypothetical protein [bacterium]
MTRFSFPEAKALENSHFERILRTTIHNFLRAKQYNITFDALNFLEALYSSPAHSYSSSYTCEDMVEALPKLSDFARKLERFELPYLSDGSLRFGYSVLLNPLPELDEIYDIVGRDKATDLDSIAMFRIGEDFETEADFLQDIEFSQKTLMYKRERNPYDDRGFLATIYCFHDYRFTEYTCHLDSLKGEVILRGSFDDTF